ncbi:MAG TPA: glycosyltransferase family 2 protein [Anaerolineae bacterium]|nr:glycosyltransferase family 2 protein [Anaerolineae bacterium]HOQ97312.1 glycosyltransferase family 2 protein [Anaerolineae bacterium]HOQ97357.1 glycosyltransferase family 2 protein [Anaerolineae bacterium]HPL30313.1 glycosyltransferase family 2 protein [Anaerolineae bacterium]
MSKLSVVIPAWNEQEAITTVVERILAAAEGLRQRAGVTDLEVLVVDDGSSDGTAQAVARFAAGCTQRRKRVRLLQHEANRGYGAALQTGFAAAGGSLLAFLDADCTYPPEHLPELCRSLLHAPEVDLVLGDRLHSHASQMPLVRRIGNALFAAMVGLLTRRPAVDCCSGMRVMHASTWRALGPLPTGLDFTPAMTVRALLSGVTIGQVVIPYYERVGRSKLSVLRDGVRFVRTIVREAHECDPGRIWAATGLAGALSLLGLTAGMAAVCAAQHAPWAFWGLGALLSVGGLVAGWSFLLGPALPERARRLPRAEEERAL